MPTNAQFLSPVLALVAWTFVMWVWMYATRIPAMNAAGLDPQEAQQIAAQLIADPARAVSTLAMEELGVDPKELGGSAWVAAITSFILFAIGAVIPVIPYGLLEGQAALWTSVVASAFGLFGIGALITLMTGKSVWFSGLRQLLFGLVAAALTYGIGHLIGVSLAG